MELNLLLQELGFSKKESAVYLATLKLGESTIKPIAEEAKIKRTSIYNFIDQLVAQEVIIKNVIKGRRHYRAAAPSKLLEIQKAKLEKLEGNIDKLNNLYQKSTKNFKVSFFEGPAEVKNIVKEETNCHQEAKYIWPGQDIMEMIGGVSYMSKIDQERISRGVTVKTIRFRQKDVKFPTSAHGEKYLRHLRFAPSYFNTAIGLGIYDTGKVGFFSSKQEGFGLLIESQELHDLMSNLYKMLWNDCIPAKEGEG